MYVNKNVVLRVVFLLMDVMICVMVGDVVDD